MNDETPERAEFDTEVLLADGGLVSITFSYDVGRGIDLIWAVKRLNEPDYLKQVVWALREDKSLVEAIEKWRGHSESEV